MCGLAGIVVGKGTESIERPVLEKMIEVIDHRGPDDSGLYLNEKKTVGLGSTRLAIVDLSPKGHMPMTRAGGKLWIAFNGEVYNFQEQRKALEQKGHRFESGTDTEVVLALYEEYGVDCLQYLRGMFAFAIWDEAKQRLFCARDRVGQKPFKYWTDGEQLIFGSELKSILQHPSVPRQVDMNAIHHFLSFQYVPNPQTGFKNIHKLPPGHYLLFEKGKLKIEPYWNLDYREKLSLSESEWVDRLDHALQESVKLRMISDVPLGAFLSGGIDSSLIVAMMSQLSDQPVKTFSIGFAEKAFSELPYARTVAEHFGTDHHEFVVEPETMDLFDDLVLAYEEPFADPASLPTYYVSKLARDHVTVALNGDGGDENFSGYPWYPIHQFALKYQRVPRALRAAAAGGAGAMARVLHTTFFDRAARFAQSGLQNPYAQYFQYTCFFTDEQKQQWFTPQFMQHQTGPNGSALVESWFKDALADNDMDRAWHVDIQHYLPDALLVKVDIASMMVSLEGRSPFLDHPLMELAAQLPPHLKQHGRTQKYILKKLAERYLPRSITHRKKQGFNVPLSAWFKGKLKTFTHDTLLSGELVRRGWINENNMAQILKTHEQTSMDYSKQLWALLNLDRWLALYQLDS
jgi:asparagine synthase (glutamine-hydrolysing)